MDDIVFLFDVDNTLLDNDAVQGDLSAHLADDVTARRRETATGRSSKSCAANSATPTISARSSATGSRTCTIRRILRMSNWLVDYPFADRLYPQALEAVRHVRQWGRPVVLSDGDAVFQPRKVERSGLWQAFNDDMLIYIHKEEELADVERLYPAAHYVLIDDKLRILAAVKACGASASPPSFRGRVITRTIRKRVRPIRRPTSRSSGSATLLRSIAPPWPD